MNVVRGVLCAVVAASADPVLPRARVLPLVCLVDWAAAQEMNRPPTGVPWHLEWSGPYAEAVLVALDRDRHLQGGCRRPSGAIAGWWWRTRCRLPNSRRTLWRWCSTWWRPRGRCGRPRSSRTSRPRIRVRTGRGAGRYTWWNWLVLRR
jgi:hypothetical protein